MYVRLRLRDYGALMKMRRERERERDEEAVSLFVDIAPS